MKRLTVWSGATAALALWTVLAFGAGWAAGQNRLVHRLASPDGSWVAQVRARAALDPPAQSLWLGPRGGPLRRLARLAEDQEWCDEVVWSDDGSRVGFLISGARLEVYGVPGGRLLGSTELLPEGIDSGRREVRQVSFLSDGRSVRFTDCLRGQARCLGERELTLVELGATG